MIAIQAFVNIGVVSSSWPVTGVPLPFISFGGSSLVVNLIAVALIANVGRHRTSLASRRDRRFRRRRHGRASLSRQSQSPTPCATRGAKIAFIGTADRLESDDRSARPATSCTRSRADRCRARSRSICCGRSRANVTGTLQSLRLLAAQRPDLVIATGGYVCFPVALAARLRGSCASPRAPRAARAQRGARFDEPAAGADGRRSLGSSIRRGMPDARSIAAHAARRATKRLRGSGSIRRCERSLRWAEAKARARSTMR